jgi:hypothetical protein
VFEDGCHPHPEDAPAPSATAASLSSHSVQRGISLLAKRQRDAEFISGGYRHLPGGEPDSMATRRFGPVGAECCGAPPRALTERVSTKTTSSPPARACAGTNGPRAGRRCNTDCSIAERQRLYSLPGCGAGSRRRRYPSICRGKIRTATPLASSHLAQRDVSSRIGNRNSGVVRRPRLTSSHQQAPHSRPPTHCGLAA